MNKYDRPVTVQLFVNGPEALIPKPAFAVTGRDAEAICFQMGQREIDLCDAVFDIRKRQRCEQTETTGKVLPHFCAELVPYPRLVAPLHVTAGEDRSGIGDSGRDPGFIHRGDGSLRAPASHELLHGLGSARRKNMMMNVDETDRLRSSRLGRP